MKKQFLTGMILALPLFLTAQEHPKEHPTQPASAVKQEHPEGKEHPKSQEHPKQGTDQEHPKGKEHPAGHEHPKGHEHPVGSKPWTQQIRKEYTRTVEDSVKRQSSGAGGYFGIMDQELKKNWRLKLVRVHKNNIVHLGSNDFFACADFKSVRKGEKDMLDLDFYATKKQDGSWTINQTLIHKVNGEPRYTYNDKNERVSVK